MAVIFLNIENYSSMAMIVFEIGEKSSRVGVIVRGFAPRGRCL